jgi:energy-coupling factor transport system substrate-specific component
VTRLNGYIKLTKTQEIALIGLLAAINIASRVVLQSLPNIKPVTAIIIISVVVFGIAFGIKLSLVTVLVSNLILGMGIYTLFQILAWTVIAALAGLFVKVIKKQSLILMALFAGFTGYVFGFFVSLEKLFFMGFKGFLVYYVGGLYFDTLHAAGNFVFYLIFAPLLYGLFNRFYKREQNPGRLHS